MHYIFDSASSGSELSGEMSSYPVGEPDWYHTHTINNYTTPNDPYYAADLLLGIHSHVFPDDISDSYPYDDSVPNSTPSYTYGIYFIQKVA
jgi:hypothetical protein